MKWKSTWLLVLLVAALFAFITLVERRYWRPTSAGGEPLPRLASFKAAEVTNIQLRITNQLVLRVERPLGAPLWQLTVPFHYPGHLHAIEWVLQELEQLGTHAFLSPAELKDAKRTLADYGLDLPQTTLTLQHNGQRTEIAFGSKTPTGDMIYAQVQNIPGVFVVSTEVFQRLPRTPNDWRDVALINLIGVPFNRLEVRAPGRGFALDSTTNGVFVLSKPTPARADADRVVALLRNLMGAQVTKFVNDSPRADLEAYGLQPPELELAFATGTNDQLVVQFGKSPTNDASVVYARRLAQTNIVLVPRAVLDTLLVTHGELRDRRLLTFAPLAVDTIEVVGAENFTVRHLTNGTWTVGDTQPTLADPDLMREWLITLATLEGTVESDVVTDFKTLYHLAPPARQYFLKATVTNASGGTSNRILAQLDLGARQGDKAFARRPDEQSVYSLALTNVMRLPAVAWQLRDRRVWNFTTNQINRVTLHDLDQTKTLQRGPGGSWNFAPGSSGIIKNPFAIEELMLRLGELRADSWVARGEEARAAYGFTAANRRLVFELKNGDKPQEVSLEFGKPSPTGFPYALATVDGQAWIFEFPRILFILLIRDLFHPLMGGGE